MIVVTGGAGFIGSNVVAGLEERGTRGLVVCDRLERGDKWRNLARRELEALVPPEELFEFLGAHAGEVEAIVHMGAVSSTTETDADLIAATNVRLPLALWEWCAREGVRFIYASSAATYGDGSQGFDDDPDPGSLARLRPLNPYGWSKQLFDRMVARRVAEGRPAPPQWAGLKFFNVYGPNEYHKGSMRSVALQAFEQIRERGAVTLFRSHHPDYVDGGQLRDFVWVGDCVEVVAWLLGHPGVSGLFNVGTGRARSFLDLAHAVFAALGREPRIEWVDTPAEIRERYQYFTEARMERLRAAGYDAPFTGLEEGVVAYVRDYLATDDPYR